MHRWRDSLAAKAIRTWRDFLLYAAIDDPLAMAIIVAQKKIIQGLTLQGKSRGC